MCLSSLVKFSGQFSHRNKEVLIALTDSVCISSSYRLISKRLLSTVKVGGVMEIHPLELGAEVTGVSLRDPVPDDIIKRIKEEVHKHRLLIFKNQGEITGNRHVEISKWFGELESTFYKHPKSPHPDVFRVSNVEEEGCRNVGRTGWHIDGSFMEKPFGYSLYYMHVVPKSGDTGMFRTIDRGSIWR